MNVLVTELFLIQAFIAGLLTCIILRSAIHKAIYLVEFNSSSIFLSNLQGCNRSVKVNIE